MPFGGGKTATLNVSGIAWDADLVVPAARKITVDHIAETTGAHGIVTDQALKPAAGVTGNLTQNADLVIPAAYKVTVDHIAETTGAHGIVTNVKLLPAEAVTLVAGKILSADHIAEVTAGHNIIADNLLSGVLVLASASDTLQKSDDASVGVGNTAYTLAKTIVVPSNHLPCGVYRVKFLLLASGGASCVTTGKIYINGVAVGTERTVTNTSNTFSEDITIPHITTANTQIQLYCHRDTDGGSYSCANFRVYCTQTLVSSAW